MSSHHKDFTEHINNVIEKGKNLTSWILRCFKSRDKLVMLTLWKSLVLPTIEYCSILWSPSKLYQIQSLEQLQWSFIRKITGTTGMNYWECLSKFKIYSLQRRRECYTIIYMWKIVEGLVPNVNNLISSYKHIRLGRKCNTVSHNNKLKDQQITCIGVRLFNLMPKSIRNITEKDVNYFKQELDKFLTNIPDEPNILGHQYQRRSKTNSLVDMIGTWNMERGRAFNCSS